MNPTHRFHYLPSYSSRNAKEYLKGMAGYLLLTVIRVAAVIFDILKLVLSILKCESTTLRKASVKLAQNLAHLPSSLIGIVCPPLASRIDAWIRKSLREDTRPGNVDAPPNIFDVLDPDNLGSDNSSVFARLDAQRNPEESDESGSDTDSGSNVDESSSNSHLPSQVPAPPTNALGTSGTSDPALGVENCSVSPLANPLCGQDEIDNGGSDIGSGSNVGENSSEYSYYYEDESSAEYSYYSDFETYDDEMFQADYNPFQAFEADQLRTIQFLCLDAGKLCYEYGIRDELQVERVVQVVFLLSLKRSNAEADFFSLGEIRDKYSKQLKKPKLVKKLIQSWKSGRTQPLFQEISTHASTYFTEQREKANAMLYFATSYFNVVAPEELYGEAILEALNKAYATLSKKSKDHLSRTKSDEDHQSLVSRRKQRAQNRVALMMLYFYVTSLPKVCGEDNELTDKTKTAFDAYNPLKGAVCLDVTATKYFRNTAKESSQKGRNHCEIDGEVSEGNRKTKRSQRVNGARGTAANHNHSATSNAPAAPANFLSKICDLKETYMTEEGPIFKTLLKRIVEENS